MILTSLDTPVHEYEPGDIVSAMFRYDIAFDLERRYNVSLSIEVHLCALSSDRALALRRWPRVSLTIRLSADYRYI
jgi:hypothetical protein